MRLNGDVNGNIPQDDTFMKLRLDFIKLLKEVRLRDYSLLMATFMLGLVLIEFALRLLSPPIRIGVGTAHTAKSKIYGWVSLPSSHEAFINPDTGEINFFKTNSQGWKDIEHQFAKPKGIVRILFLGDSVTDGVVGLNDLYTRQTDNLLRKLGFSNCEVISIGVGGWGTDQELEALQAEGLKYNLDFVIYQFSANDITDNLFPMERLPLDEIQWKKVFKYKLINGALNKIKLNPKIESNMTTHKMKNFLLASALIYNLNNAKNKIGSYLKMKLFPKQYGYESMITKHWWDKYPINPLDTYYRHNSVEQSDRYKEGWKLLEALIVQFKHICDQNNVKFIVFSAEGENGKRVWEIKWDRIRTDGVEDFVILNEKKYLVDTKSPLNELARICRKYNIPLIEPKREYQRYDYDPHPNKIGNYMMARDIVDFLVGFEPFLNKVKKGKVK